MIKSLSNTVDEPSRGGNDFMLSPVRRHEPAPPHQDRVSERKPPPEPRTREHQDTYTPSKRPAELDHDGDRQ